MKHEPPARPARAVLEGVRRVGFGIVEEQRDAEGFPFPSCLSAALEVIGEDYGYTDVEVEGKIWRDNNAYVFSLGTSGAAFRLSWKPGWHPDNVALVNMSDDPEEPLRRAFASVGFGYEHVVKQEGRDNEARFRRRILESIHDRGRPVLAFGVVGPPECSIVAGYDDGGDVLVGWSFFQGFPEFKAGLEFEPCGYFRKRGWLADTEALVVIGDKRERPPLGETYRRALRWALEVVRTPATAAGCHNGLAAYPVWAGALLHDEDFPADDMAVIRERFMVHNDAVGMVAEGRWYAGQFLKQVAEHEPAMAEDLLAAAACYKAEHDLMWRIWNLVGGLGFSDQHVEKLAQPAVRRRIAPIILAARDRDAEAARHVERALTTGLK